MSGLKTNVLDIILMFHKSDFLLEKHTFEIFSSSEEFPKLFTFSIQLSIKITLEVESIKQGVFKKDQYEPQAEKHTSLGSIVTRRQLLGFNKV